MAKSTEVETVEEAGQVIGYASTDFEWETAHVEAATQLKFDTLGDTLIAKYAGHEIIYPEPEKDPTKFFIQLKWTLPTDEAVFVNAGYELANAFTETTYNSDGVPTVTDKIPVGTITRVELRKLVDVDQASPMKSYRVDTAKSNGSAGNSGS
jgi:hypothetical protein